MQDNERITQDDAGAFVDIDTVVAAVRELKDVVAEETVMLADMQLAQVENLQEKKSVLIDQLEASTRLVQADKAALIPPSAGQERQLREAQEDLQEVMTENILQLTKAREVNRMMVDAIVDAVSRQVNGATGYNGQGGDQHGVIRAEGAVPPMQLNEEI